MSWAFSPNRATSDPDINADAISSSTKPSIDISEEEISDASSRGNAESVVAKYFLEKGSAFMD